MGARKNKTNEEKFLDVLYHMNLELRKIEGYGYLLYDAQTNKYYPSLPETLEDTIGSLIDKKDVDIKQGDDGAYRLVYTGDNQDYATLFNATPEERETVYADLVKKCKLDVNKFIRYLICNDTSDAYGTILWFADEIYSEDVNDKCQTYKDDYDEEYDDNTVYDLDGILALENILKNNAATDKNANRLLDELAPYLEDVHFIMDVMETVDLDKVYAYKNATNQ